MALNPYEFWNAFEARVARTAYPMPTCCPIFSLIEATFSLTHFTSSITRKEGGRHWGGSAPPNPPGGIVPIEHLAPIIVWYDQLRDYPINSEFWAKFRFTHKDDENCYKMNLYTYSSFHSQKLPCFQRIIKEGLWSYRFFLSVRPNMVGSVTEKNCV